MNSFFTPKNSAMAFAERDGRNYRIALDNSTPMDDEGWALIAPFGEHPKTRLFRENGQVKEQKFIQVLDEQSANALVNDSDSFGSLKRAIVGVPIYKDHGDLQDVDPKAIPNGVDKLKIGVVAQARKSDRGIEGRFLLDQDGADVVAKGWNLPSAFWMVAPIGNSGDAIRARPFKLLSVALTNCPNIPGVESLANSADPASFPNDAIALPNEYQMAFAHEMDATGGNPVRAHQNVMTLPKYAGLAARFAARRLNF